MEREEESSGAIEIDIEEDIPSESDGSLRDQAGDDDADHSHTISSDHAEEAEDDGEDEGEEEEDDDGNQEQEEADERKDDDDEDDDIELVEGRLPNGAIFPAMQAQDQRLQMHHQPFEQGQQQQKPKKKRNRSTNKISFEDLAASIKQNMSKRVDDTDSQKKSRFEWVTYDSSSNCSDRTLNYISDFLERSAASVGGGGGGVDYARLDLMEFEQAGVVHHHSQVSSVTDDIYKRILRYGQVDNISRIAKKSGAIQKGDTAPNNFRDELYYDQNDPFIDDDEYTNAPKGGLTQRMQLAEVFLEDFRSAEGDLREFVSSDIYKNRVDVMQNLEKKTQLGDTSNVTTSAATAMAVAAAGGGGATASTNTASANNNSADKQNFQQRKKPVRRPKKDAIDPFSNLSINNPLANAIQSATVTLKAANKKSLSDLEKDVSGQIPRVSPLMDSSPHLPPLILQQQNERKKLKKDGGTGVSSQQQLSSSQLVTGNAVCGGGSNQLGGLGMNSSQHSTQGGLVQVTPEMMNLESLLNQNINGLAANQQAYFMAAAANNQANMFGQQVNYFQSPEAQQMLLNSLNQNYLMLSQQQQQMQQQLLPQQVQSQPSQTPSNQFMYSQPNQMQLLSGMYQQQQQYSQPTGQMLQNQAAAAVIAAASLAGQTTMGGSQTPIKKEKKSRKKASDSGTMSKQSTVQGQKNQISSLVNHKKQQTKSANGSGAAANPANQVDLIEIEDDEDGVAAAAAQAVAISKSN